MSETDETTAGPEADELADAVRDLRETVASLRDDVRRASALPPEPGSLDAGSHSWLALVEAPRRKRLAIPRLLLEGLFLAVCAAAAGIADLDPFAIAAVMAGAWALVALVELTASRVDRARDELLYAVPPASLQPESALPTADPAWYSPPAEQTMLDVAEADATAVTRLPPRVEHAEAPGAEASDVTFEQRPGS